MNVLDGLFLHEKRVLEKQIICTYKNSKILKKGIQCVYLHTYE